MHGRLKVRTTEEQMGIKQKEQQQKLLAYREGMNYIHATRYDKPYNKKSLAVSSAILEKQPDVSTLWNFRKEVMEQEVNKLNDQYKSDACLFKENMQELDGNVVFGLVNSLYFCFKGDNPDEIEKHMKMFKQIDVNADMCHLLDCLIEGMDEYLLNLVGILGWFILYSWQNQEKLNNTNLKQLWNDLYVKLEAQKTFTDIEVYFGKILSIIRDFISEEGREIEIFKQEELHILVENLRKILRWSVCHHLQKEITLTERCLLANPKSYGAWHHRYWVLERHPQPNWAQELHLVEKYLRYDDRNFHTWDYRRLLLKKLERDLDAELQFSTERINTNFSNYSSWHYRSTLNCLTTDTVAEELHLVQNAVFTDPYDSSTWFYLRWVLSNQAVTDSHRQALLGDFEQLLMLEPTCKWIYLAKCWIKGNAVEAIEGEVDKNMNIGRTLMELDPMRKGLYQDYFKLGV